ncbi:cytochrome P450 72A15-like [Triticum urartu]|nr:cytochrome P450 72A15-like isoform X2 [Triticum aestivum]XP_048550573.1 cytochrome P450 72A15-like [Triticum urartu]
MEEAMAILRDASPWSLLAGAAAMAALWWAVRMLEWVWWGPRRIERALRAQGLGGTQYRLLRGDIKEEQRLMRAALSKPVPMDRPHDIVPRVSPLLHRVTEQHGKVSFTWFGPYPRITISDPELVRQVLANKFGHFDKTKLARLAKVFIGGLAVLDGEEWAKHRRIMNPAFHAEKLKRMLPAFSASCSELIDRWENLVTVSVGAIELDVWSEFQDLSGEVISRAAFGVTNEEGRRIFQLQAEQAERLVQSFRTNYIPGFSLLPTENNRRMKAINTEVKAILRGIIEKRQKYMKNGGTDKDDLLGLLLESNMDYSDADGKTNKGMTVEDVIDECKLFYFAGMETTAVLLSWTVVLLSMHPEWQDRAREEVLQVFGKNKPDLNGLSRLKVVMMVFNEVLRLYPPVMLINRRTYKKIELGGVTYPPNVMLALQLMFIHRDPAIWGDDAGEFNPGRFAEGVSKASRDPGAFFAFSSGPRNCIGQNFALLEAKVAISMILQRFSFELSPTYMHAPYAVLTLHPQHGVPVRLHRL